MVVNLQLVGTLVCGALGCMRDDPSHIALAVKMASTLEVVMDSTAPERLVMFPQLFWVAVAFCQADYVHVYLSGLRLLECALRKYGECITVHTASVDHPPA